MYTGPILLNGDMVASLSGAPTQVGNPGDPNFAMVLPGVDALAGPETTYRLVWHQNVNPSATQFANGQVWRLEVYTGTGEPATDPTGWVTVPGYTNLVPKNDLVANVGAGDEYIVFQRDGGGYLLYDLNGGLPTTPTTLNYRGDAQNGGPLGDNDSELDFSDGYAAYQPICFCAGTMIEAERGPVLIEDLAVGDLVQTLDHGLQPLRWIDRRVVTLAETVAHPDLLPILVTAGAMGPGLPTDDLRLSPQHRVLLRSRIAERMTGTAETLVAVKHLCGHPGVAQAVAPQQVTYFHLRLDRHELVRANGLWAETLLIGLQALRAMGPDARRELRLLFPALANGDEAAARMLLRGRMARQLVNRHLRNDRHLVDSVV